MMRCMVCGTNLTHERIVGRSYLFWVENRLLRTGSPICEAHDIRRACVSCQTPTESLDDDTCSACGGSPDSADFA